MRWKFCKSYKPFLFSSKGIPSTPQHTDCHPCTRPGSQEPRISNSLDGLDITSIDTKDTDDSLPLAPNVMALREFQLGNLQKLLQRASGLLRNVNNKVADNSSGSFNSNGLLSGQTPSPASLQLEAPPRAPPRQRSASPCNVFPAHVRQIVQNSNG